jgi:tetratricopeptide (TPR) repeat protein
MSAVLALVVTLVSPGPAQDFEELFLRGLELSEQGEHVEALQAFRAAAALSPDHAYVHYNIAGILEEQGRTAEALEAFEKAAELAPAERPLQLALGEALYRSGRRGEALPALEKAAAPPEPMPEALVYIAAILEAEGKSEESWSLLRQYLTLRPDDLKMRLLLGEQLSGNRRYEEAIEVWKGGEPNAELDYRIGESLSRKREGYSEAESYLREALVGDPRHLEARVLLGRILARQGRPEQGLEELERAAEDHPEAPDVYFTLASVYQQLGRAEEAQAARGRFQELSREAERREHLDAQLKVTYKGARELLAAGKVEEAEKAFRSVLELDPDNTAGRSMLAKIAYSKGELAEARKWIAGALKKDDSSAELHYLDGFFASKAGDPSRAEAAVRRSLELMPGFPDAWSLLGSILADSGRPAEAVDCYLKAAALEPSNPSVQLNLAAAYHALGKKEEEEQAMERYRELSASKDTNE